MRYTKLLQPNIRTLSEIQHFLSGRQQSQTQLKQKNIQQGFHAVQNERSTPVSFSLHCDVIYIKRSRLILYKCKQHIGLAELSPIVSNKHLLCLFLAQRAGL
jgi:hypothetical protein